MNPKLLMGLVVGIKASFLLPLVAQAAVIEPNAQLITGQSRVEVEVVDFNQGATGSFLVADNNDYDQKRRTVRRGNSDDNSRRYRRPVRVQQRGRIVRPVRVYRPARVYRPYGVYRPSRVYRPARIYQPVRIIRIRY